jgi:putative membrane protein insertion efficiency factor
MNPLQHILVFAVRVYRWTVSPAQTFLFGPTGGCRFTPTCSQYAIEAIGTRGAVTGGWLAVKRICRCHPWGNPACAGQSCGYDPAPKKEFGI